MRLSAKTVTADSVSGSFGNTMAYLRQGIINFTLDNRMHLHTTESHEKHNA